MGKSEVSAEFPQFSNFRLLHRVAAAMKKWAKQSGLRKRKQRREAARDLFFKETNYTHSSAFTQPRRGKEREREKQTRRECVEQPKRRRRRERGRQTQEKARIFSIAIAVAKRRRSFDV